MAKTKAKAKVKAKSKVKIKAKAKAKIKTPAKKSAPKKVAKKTAVKTPAKKIAAKSSKKVMPSKKPTKKTAGKTTPTKLATKKPVKSIAKKSMKTSPQANPPKPVSFSKTASSSKKLDLSGFVTPLDDRLIVQLSGAEKMTAGGLYIPDTVSDVSGNMQGQVVAVGRGHMNKKGHLYPMDVRVGDKVVFSEHAGSKIKIQNEDLIILREVDVMGVVSK